MKPWIAVGFAAFMLSSSVIGIRLLLLWRRTRRLPELLIACGILGIGPVGLSFAVLDVYTRETLPQVASTAVAGALLSLAVGALATAVFNWRVFRPDRPVVRLLVWAAAVGFAAAFVWESGASGFSDMTRAVSGYRLASILSTSILLWGSAESLRYYAMMRRRARLGMADPLLTNRFLLWGLGIGAAGLGSLISIAGQVVTGQHMLELPWLTASNSLHGFTAAVLMWVAFLPPGFYRRFVESRARRAAA